MMLHFTLPVPPSTNALFATVRGRRIKTRAYKEWQLEASLHIGRVTAFALTPASVTIQLCGVINERRDGDNCVKPTLDLLVFRGVLPDDSLKHVRRIVLEYRPDVLAGRVEVVVEACGEMR